MYHEISSERPLEGVPDPGVDRALRRALREQAAHDPDPVAREMASELLAGRVTLDEAAHSRAYGEVLASRVDEFVARWDRLSESEREEQAARGREEVARLRADAMEEAARMRSGAERRRYA